MTAPDPLFLLQYLQIKDSRLYDFLRFLLQRISNLQNQINNLPAPSTAAPVAPGSAMGGTFNINFGATLDDIKTGSVADARITGTEYIVLGLGPGGPGHTDGTEDPVLEQIHLMVSAISVGSFSWVAHAPNRTKDRYTAYWVGVA
jgi:hypothetical protein